MINFADFASLLNEHTVGDQIVARRYVHGHLIEQLVDGDVLINRNSSPYQSIEEATQWVRDSELVEHISDQLQHDLYSDVPAPSVASIVEKYSDQRVTNQVVEQYVTSASSKQFTLDPIVVQIRERYDIDTLQLGRIEYILEDGSSVYLTNQTLSQISEIVSDHPDIIDYMKQSADNFFGVLRHLEEL